MALPSEFPSEDELLTIIMHTSSTVWDNNLSEKDIETWLGNFTGDILPIKEERLLALWLLSHFTFYNKKEVAHLCKVLFDDLVHHICLNGDQNDITSEVNLFFKSANIISAGKASDSGGFIAYFFRQENSLPMAIFNFSIHNVADDIDTLIIIDDVTLTAHDNSQACIFFKEAKKIHPNKKFFLLTLIANSDAVTYLKNKLGIEVISAITLDKRDKCFDEHSDVCSSFQTIIPTAKSFALHYGAKSHSEIPLGYMDGQYTFGFFYNTPDNTLPIFWGSVNNWIPILKRYHKNYNNRSYLKNERFL